MIKPPHSLSLFLLIVLFGGLTNCSSPNQDQKKGDQQAQKNPGASKYEKGTFGYDLQFLRRYQNTVTLKNPDENAMVVICPGYQGRVMTSSANGLEGKSYGWINHDLIASGENKPHINPYGGEERFWLGPEGGQFSLYFPPGKPFEFKHWQTPGLIDTARFKVVKQNKQMVRFKKQATLTNYSQFTFDFTIERQINILENESISEYLGVSPGSSLNQVAFSSKNIITNTGNKPWKKSTGLMSIWILGMYQPSDQTVIMIPYENPTNTPVDQIVNDAYFGAIPKERLKIQENMIYFKGDGKQRGKIGVGPLHAQSIMGSYDIKNRILTIVQYNKPANETDYVNSLWKHQENPYGGDVVNAYNDGPLEDGSIMGPFYELETSSPAADLNPGESIEHIHRTFHFQGPEAQLDPLVQQLFGVKLDEIKQVF